MFVMVDINSNDEQIKIGRLVVRFFGAEEFAWPDGLNELDAAWSISVSRGPRVERTSWQYCMPCLPNSRAGARNEACILGRGVRADGCRPRALRDSFPAPRLLMVETCRRHANIKKSIVDSLECTC